MFYAEFWAAAASAIFVGVLLYLGVHEIVFRFIDWRRDQISAELEAARALKVEAQALAEVRGTAAAAAVDSAERILTITVKGEIADRRAGKSIAALQEKLIRQGPPNRGQS